MPVTRFRISRKIPGADTCAVSSIADLGESTRPKGVGAFLGGFKVCRARGDAPPDKIFLVTALHG